MPPLCGLCVETQCEAHRINNRSAIKASWSDQKSATRVSRCSNLMTPSGTTPGRAVKSQAPIQPRKLAYQSGSKTSDFLDSWSALALILCLSVIGVLFFRKR